MERLQELLVLRNKSPELAKKIDEDIWKEFGTKKAVLVSDMSGFTRTTKEFGIVHFLAMHSQAVALSHPDILSHNGYLVKHDADNLIALFDAPVDAIRSSIHIHQDVAAYNRTIEYDRQIGVCIGISFGKILMTEHEVFGDAVNVAYKLGEDIADPFDILVSDDALAEILMREQATEFEFHAREEVLTSKVRLGFQRVVFVA